MNNVESILFCSVAYALHTIYLCISVSIFFMQVYFSHDISVLLILLSLFKLFFYQSFWDSKTEFPDPFAVGYRFTFCKHNSV